MPGPSTIPPRDLDALDWMQNFAGVLTSSYASYFVTALDAAHITSVVNAYASALSVARAPATRTPGTIEVKDAAKAAALQLCRQYAIQIKYNAGISDQAKIDAGVRPVNPARQPVPPPSTPPVLTVLASTYGAQTVEVRDALEPLSRAKPPNATSLQLYVAIGPAPATDLAEARFLGNYTRTPVPVAFDHADNGKYATYFARWLGTRGQVGPWSTPESFPIAA